MRLGSSTRRPDEKRDLDLADGQRKQRVWKAQGKDAAPGLSCCMIESCVAVVVLVTLLSVFFTSGFLYCEDLFSHGVFGLVVFLTLALILVDFLTASVLFPTGFLPRGSPLSLILLSSSLVYWFCIVHLIGFIFKFALFVHRFWVSLFTFGFFHRLSHWVHSDYWFFIVHWVSFSSSLGFIAYHLGILPFPLVYRSDCFTVSVRERGEVLEYDVRRPDDPLQPQLSGSSLLVHSVCTSL